MARRPDRQEGAAPSTQRRRRKRERRIRAHDDHARPHDDNRAVRRRVRSRDDELEPLGVDCHHWPERDHRGRRREHEGVQHQQFGTWSLFFCLFDCG